MMEKEAILNKVVGSYTRTARPPLSEADLAFLQTCLSHKFEADGRIVQCYLKGKGPMVLLLHGFYSSCASLIGFVQPLLEKGFQVVLMDAPGHGRSEGDHCDAVVTNIAIQKLVDTFGEFYAVIAHSYGCISALYAHAQRPVAEKFVLLSIPSTITCIVDKYFEVFNIDRVLYDDFVKRLQERYGGEFQQTFSPKDIVNHIDAELILVHDTGDEVFPIQHAEAVLYNSLKANLILTEGLGHFGVLSSERVWRQVSDEICA